MGTGLGDRIKALMEEKHIKGFQALSNLMPEYGRVSRARLSQIANGPPNATMMPENLRALAQAFGVTMTYMSSGKGPKTADALSTDAQHLAAMYDHLPERAQAELKGYLRYIIDREHEVEHRPNDTEPPSMEQLLLRLTNGDPVENPD